jgi:hypothetical protein
MNTTHQSANKFDVDKGISIMKRLKDVDAMLQNMPHTGAIRNEVARLELIAHDIEKKAAKLVDEIDIGREQRTYNLDDRTYYVYVFTPNSSQQAQVRKLAAKYEAWYNLANELIHAHLPNRVADFEQC